MDRDDLWAVQIALRTAQTALRDPPWKIEPYWIAEAAVTLALINLKDALCFLRAQDEEVRVEIALEEESITKLMLDARNVACHVTSKDNLVSPNAFMRFGTIIGRRDAMQVGETVITNPFDDDVMFFWGTIRVLYRRHFLAAIDGGLEKCTEIEAKVRY